MGKDRVRVTFPDVANYFLLVADKELSCHAFPNAYGLFDEPCGFRLVWVKRAYGCIAP